MRAAVHHQLELVAEMLVGLAGAVRLSVFVQSEAGHQPLVVYDARRRLPTRKVFNSLRVLRESKRQVRLSIIIVTVTSHFILI